MVVRHPKSPGLRPGHFGTGFWSGRVSRTAKNLPRKHGPGTGSTSEQPTVHGVDPAEAPRPELRSLYLSLPRDLPGTHLDTGGIYEDISWVIGRVGL